MNYLSDLELCLLVICCVFVGIVIGSAATLWLMRRIQHHIFLRVSNRLDVVPHAPPRDRLPGDEWKEG